MPRCGRSQERSSDQTPSSVLTWTSQKPSPSSSRAFAAPAALRAAAEVATDGTLGPRATLAGPDVEIGVDLGQVRGRNLFHSFQRFDVETGGRATFTGPDGLENVIGRVTGGARSSIDGTLRSTIPGTDLYLLNPAGIVFGPNARLDVRGAFHASTAGELRFADGTAFSALDPAGSTLSVAEPQAFGFLRGPAAGVAVDGSTLEVPTGEALSLTGGEVVIGGGTLRNRPDLAGPGQGSIVVAAQQAARAVPVALDAPAVARDGPVRIISSGTGAGGLSLDASGGGRIRIEGGEVVVDGVDLSTTNRGDADDTGGVNLAAGTLIVQGRDLSGTTAGGIVTSSLGAGQAGPITVSAATPSRPATRARSKLPPGR
jgi:filamentous hemagglutinin family protein